MNKKIQLKIKKIADLKDKIKKLEIEVEALENDVQEIKACLRPQKKKNLIVYLKPSSLKMTPIKNQKLKIKSNH